MTEEKKHTSVRIIEATLHLILEQGYHATSMRQIAEQIEIVPAGIYNHFKDKDEIFLAVLDTYHPWLMIPQIVEQAAGDNLNAFVKDASVKAQQAIEERKQLVKLHFIELVEFNGVHLPALFQKAFQAMVKALNEKADQYPKLNPSSIAHLSRALLGLFFSYMMNDPDVAGVSEENTYFGGFDYLNDIYLQGIIERIDEQGTTKVSSKR